MSSKRFKNEDTFWKVSSVISCFFINVFSGGVANSYGILYAYMQQILDIPEYRLAWIGSFMSGFQGFACIVGAGLIEMFGARMTIYVSPVFAAMGLVISSQTNSLLALYVTLGALTGFGLGLCMLASYIAVSQNFTKWRPVAVALGSCGIAAGIQTWPPLTSWLAEVYGWRGAVLIQGAIMLNIIPCAMVTKPTSKQETQTDSQGGSSIITTAIGVFKILWSFKVFLVFLVYAFFGMSYFTFATFVPVYIITKMSDVTTMAASLTVSLFGFGNLLGRISFSFVSMLHVRGPQFVFTVALAVCGISNMVVPLCDDMLSLQINSAVQGLFNGGYAGLIAVVVANVFGVENLPIMLGTMELATGVGSLCGPPLQSYIADVFHRQDLLFYIGGSMYLVSGLFMLPVLIFRMEHKLEPLVDVVKEEDDSPETRELL